MRRTIYTILLAIVFSFAWGLWYGLYSVEKTRPERIGGPELRFLAKKAFIPKAFLQRFSEENKVQIDLIEVDDDISLLREMVSPRMDYDLVQVPSYLTKSFLADNVLSPLSSDVLAYLDEVSVDFKNLDYDPESKYLFPLTWGVNGFLVTHKNKNEKDLTLESLLRAPVKGAFLSTLPDPVDVFFLSTKLKPVIRMYAESGNETELMKEVKEIRPRLGQVRAVSRDETAEGEDWVAQISSGKAARFISANPDQYTFVLPKERARLWIHALGIPSSSRNIKQAKRALRALSSSRWAKELSLANQEATVLVDLNNSDMPEMLKAQYIRALPISRVELFTDVESLEPLWLQAYRWITGQE